jgi:hypothetical protein
MQPLESYCPSLYYPSPSQGIIIFLITLSINIRPLDNQNPPITTDVIFRIPKLAYCNRCNSTHAPLPFADEYLTDSEPDYQFAYTRYIYEPTEDGYYEPEDKTRECESEKGGGEGYGAGESGDFVMEEEYVVGLNAVDAEVADKVLQYGFGGPRIMVFKEEYALWLKAVEAFGL